MNSINATEIFKSKFSLGKLFFILIVLTILLSRIYIAFTHFTHYDDIWPAYLLNVIWSYDSDKILVQLKNYGLPSALLDQAFFFREFDLVIAFIKFLIGPLAIAKTSTYAPLQFYFTSMIVNIDVGYQWKIFLVRLPSLISSLLFFYFLYKFIHKVGQCCNWFRLNSFFLLPAMSWMFLIYSSQGEVYAIGVLLVMVWIFYLPVLGDKNTITIKNFFTIGLLGVLSSYQLIFFLPALILSVAYHYINYYRFSRRLLIVNILLVFLSSLILFFLPFYIFIKGRLIDIPNPGVGWNAGFNNQYLFESANTYSLSSVGEFFIFLLENITDVMGAVMGFMDPGSFYSKIISWAVFVFIVIGIAVGLRNARLRVSSIFGVVSLVTWLALIYFGKLTFSPTRHSLIYIVHFCLFFAYGFIFLLESAQSRLGHIFFTATIACVALGSFWYFFYFEAIARYNPILSNHVLSAIKENRPKIIVAYGMNMDLTFDSYIKKNYTSRYINQWPFFTLYESGVSDTNGVIYMCTVQEVCKSSKAVEVINQVLGYKQSGQEILNMSTSSLVTNCFGNMAGSGTNEIRLSIYK